MNSYTNKKAAAILAANEKIKELGKLEDGSVAIRAELDEGGYACGDKLFALLEEFEVELGEHRRRALKTGK